jgi:hypothetical protein
MLAIKYVHETWHFMSNDLNLPRTQINIRRQRNTGNIRANSMAVLDGQPFAWGANTRQYLVILQQTIISKYPT